MSSNPSPQTASAHPDAVAATRRRTFAIAMGLCAFIIITGAVYPVITRYGALNLDPLLFCASAVSIAALCLTLALRRRGELATLIDRRYAPRLFTIAIAGTVITSLMMIYGLQRINAVAGVLLMQTEPVYSLMLATLIVGERPSLRQLAATATIVGGIGVVFAGGAFSPLWAALLVALTPLFWQSSHVISLKLMPPLSPMCLAGARYIYAAFVLTALLLALHPAALSQLADPSALLVVTTTGVVIYFLGTTAWYAALTRLSLAWTTALVVPGIPLLSILFAVLFLNEQATRREVLGILIAALGVVALVTSTDAHRQTKPQESAEAIHTPLT
jgi:drug/metabolite transporter (DMT)-like permease